MFTTSCELSHDALFTNCSCLVYVISNGNQNLTSVHVLREGVIVALPPVVNFYCLKVSVKYGGFLHPHVYRQQIVVHFEDVRTKILQTKVDVLTIKESFRIQMCIRDRCLDLLFLDCVCPRCCCFQRFQFIFLY